MYGVVHTCFWRRGLYCFGLQPLDCAIFSPSTHPVFSLTVFLLSFFLLVVLSVFFVSFFFFFFFLRCTGEIEDIFVCHDVFFCFCDTEGWQKGKKGHISKNVGFKMCVPFFVCTAGFFLFYFSCGPVCSGAVPKPSFFALSVPGAPTRSCVNGNV